MEYTLRVEGLPALGCWDAIVRLLSGGFVAKGRR